MRQTRSAAGLRADCRDRVLKYAGGVVVILMGVAGDGAAVIAHALAAEIGWPVVEWPGSGALRAIVARTLGRREHLVITSAPITSDDQQIVRGDLHGVRFVSLADHHGNPTDIVQTIRRDFGI
jgi:hypothetical protein